MPDVQWVYVTTFRVLCVISDFAQMSRRLGEIWQALPQKEKIVSVSEPLLAIPV